MSEAGGVPEDGPEDMNDDEWSEEGSDEEGGFWGAGQRTLTALEKRVLRRKALSLRAWAVAAALGFWIVLFCALMVGVYVEEAQGIAKAVAIVLMSLLFPGAVALFIGSWLIWQEGGILLRDARWETVKRYLVVTAQSKAFEAILEPTFRTGLLRRDSPEPQSLEQLDPSHRVWRVNDIRPADWRRMFPPGR